jgi:hypothetical protein
MKFAVDILNRTDEDEAFLLRVLFSYEATLHLPGQVNHHNFRIWAVNSHMS